MKQSILLFLMMQLAILAQANVVTINANIKGMTPGNWVYCIAFFSTKKDSVKTVAGGFHLTVNIPEGEGDMYYLQIGSEYTENKYLHLFLDKGTVTILGNRSDFNQVQLSGTRPINDLNSYNRIPQIEEMKKLGQKIKLLRDLPDSAATVAVLRQQYNALDSVKNIAARQWVEQHTASSVSPYILTTLWYAFPLPGLDSLMGKVSVQAKNNTPARQFIHNMYMSTMLGIGKPALDFTQPDTLGHPVSLKDFRGKYVLLDFWASWCHPCREENPNVRKAYEQFKDKNFTVLGVSLDEDKASWLAAVSKDGLTWTQVSDLKGGHNEASEKYGITGIPMNFLIDPTGIIIAKDLHEGDLQKKLVEVLNH